MKCKRGKKARAAGTIKNKQTLPAVYIPLLFYSGTAGAELAYFCLLFLRFWSRDQVRGQRGYLATARQYIMPVIGSRNAKINTAKRQAAYNLHYVNIA